MMTRRTLNGQPPRTLQDAGRDPFDWWEPPRPMDAVHRHARRAEALLYVVAGVVTAAWLLPVLLQHGITLLAGLVR